SDAGVGGIRGNRDGGECQGAGRGHEEDGNDRQLCRDRRRHPYVDDPAYGAADFRVLCDSEEEVTTDLREKRIRFVAAVASKKGRPMLSRRSGIVACLLCMAANSALAGADPIVTISTGQLRGAYTSDGG